MLNVIELPGDSQNYEVIAKAVEHSKDVPGLTCEIGLRRGGGTKVIVDTLARLGIKKVHIAIDPYGNIEYKPDDVHSMRLDYTNDMRDEALPNIYSYCKMKGVNFVFFNMEDSEFFARFSDGVPVYNYFKTKINSYSMVHFDGPHDYTSIAYEVQWFAERTPVGGTWVFDDIHDYDHKKLEVNDIFPAGFKLLVEEGRKAAYVKE